VEESGGKFSYVGPKLNRETNQTNFTWEYFRKGISGQEMSASKSDALLRMIERLLDDSPNYDNFFKSHCFTVRSKQYYEIERRFEIIKDMYNLESLGYEFKCEKLEAEAVHGGRLLSPLHGGAGRQIGPRGREDDQDLGGDGSQ